MHCLSHYTHVVLDFSFNDQKEGSKDVPLYASVYTVCVVQLAAHTVSGK